MKTNVPRFPPDGMNENSSSAVNEGSKPSRGINSP